MLKKFLFLLPFVVASVSCNWTDDLKNFFSTNSKDQGNTKVVGGEAAPEHVPYQISMQMSKKGGSNGGMSSLFPWLGGFNQQQQASNW